MQVFETFSAVSLGKLPSVRVKWRNRRTISWLIYDLFLAGKQMHKTLTATSPVFQNQLPSVSLVNHPFYLKLFNII